MAKKNQFTSARKTVLSIMGRDSLEPYTIEPSLELISSYPISEEKPEEKVEHYKKRYWKNTVVERQVDKETQINDVYREQVVHLKEILKEKDEYLRQIEEQYIDEIMRHQQKWQRELEQLEDGWKQRLKDITQQLQAEKEQAILDEREKYQNDFIQVLRNWLWKQVNLRIDGLDIQGILIHVSLEYLLLAGTDNVCIVPTQHARFISRPT